MKRVEKIKERMEALKISWFQLKDEKEVKRSIRIFDLQKQVDNCEKFINALNQMPFVWNQKFDVFVNIEHHFSFTFETTRAIAIITIPKKFHPTLKNGDKIKKEAASELITLFRFYRVSAQMQINFLEEEV